MTEQTAPVTPEKKELTPEQIMARNVLTMPDRQMHNRLRRLSRRGPAKLEGAWAILLSTIFEGMVITKKVPTALRG